MNDITMEDEEEKNAPQQSPYMLFLLVLVFFITGLLGILICHVLKKKGYRCRTSPEEPDPETKEALKEDQDSTDGISNEDTVERIVKCIIQNEANAEALKQMLGDTEGDVPIGPGLCPHRDSQDAGPPHHHTVHLGSTQAPCIHCTRKKRSLLHRMGRSKEGRGKSHPGEVTVFSVGRFRVTHIGKKHSIQGSQDDTIVSSEPISLDKDPEDQTEKKNQNGITTQDFQEHGAPHLSQNGPGMVGSTKFEFERDGKIKDADNNGLKKFENRIQKISVKTKASKQRRSSAPEHTAARKESGDLIEMKTVRCPEKKPTATDK
ncbi:RELT-like protein 2 [Spea bombifrons]|uniref:RELT-like protein 2 n=1 Tax=Spea bombifrons TaxID=233779 RepID=UPI002349A9E1|nr:RELT-like protein 2 [Spea bombifrons]XP_053319457.1 RELT-like protein 2 [Spea bombifrons]XP_053319458.1 RELT-like protein 2 [Spea bombifrons]